jgi:hypothetical protein
MSSKILLLIACITIVITITGCATATIKPTNTCMGSDVFRIGGAKPTDKNLEVANIGSYCLYVAEHLKANGKTPDGQTI